ncbi:hypothetical protein [Phyllobacterium lublinensis]|uniref:hypothetical protein n=1 Tax=Phyllobacterium lublinensis TaxID=2875708 RepID=UPI001CCBC629|nr:hypothetical protein [Phyllobacterium sp. 2063]MBZ9654024.1 hypothetical protein [Phyllobacterium sp. 2063]
MKTLLASLALALCASAAHATTLATCGASHGYAIFHQGGLVTADLASKDWVDDAITGGTIKLGQDDQGNPDIRVRDATGVDFSYLADGATVRFLFNDGSTYVVFAMFPKADIEIFTFSPGKVTWTQQKFGPQQVVTKTAAYLADCK